MIGARPASHAPEALLRRQHHRRPGRNCWRVERARRFHCIQDGADYFRLVRRALLDARHTMFILGWDIMAALICCLGDAAVDAPTRSTSCSLSSSDAARIFVATFSSGIMPRSTRSNAIRCRGGVSGGECLDRSSSDSTTVIPSAAPTIRKSLWWTTNWHSAAASI